MTEKQYNLATETVSALKTTESKLSCIEKLREFANLKVGAIGTHTEIIFQGTDLNNKVLDLIKEEYTKEKEALEEAFKNI